MGIGCLVNYVVSIKLAIDIDLLSLYCVISNHPVEGSIMETPFGFTFSLFPFIVTT